MSRSSAPPANTLPYNVLIRSLLSRLAIKAAAMSVVRAGHPRKRRRGRNGAASKKTAIPVVPPP